MTAKTHHLPWVPRAFQRGPGNDRDTCRFLQASIDASSLTPFRRIGGRDALHRTDHDVRSGEWLSDAESELNEPRGGPAVSDRTSLRISMIMLSPSVMNHSCSRTAKETAAVACFLLQFATTLENSSSPRTILGDDAFDSYGSGQHISDPSANCKHIGSCRCRISTLTDHT